eukprot:RCo049667
MNFLKNIGTIIEQASQQVQLKFPEKDGNELLQIDLEGLPHTELLDVAFKQRQLINEFAEERKKLISGFEPNGSDGQTPDILHKDSLATTETQKFGAEPEITVEVREVIQLRARNNDLSAQLETENGRIRELLDALQTLKQENARLLEEIMELKKGESQDAVAADLSQTLASEQRERQELASQLSEEVARRHALASALEQSEQELRRAKDSVREVGEAPSLKTVSSNLPKRFPSCRGSMKSFCRANRKSKTWKTCRQKCPSFGPQTRSCTASCRIVPVVLWWRSCRLKSKS